MITIDKCEKEWKLMANCYFIFPYSKNSNINCSQLKVCNDFQEGRSKLNHLPDLHLSGRQNQDGLEILL